MITGKTNPIRKQKKIVFLVFCICALFLGKVNATSGGGKLLSSDDNCKVWWVGSTYKIKKNDQAPVKKGNIFIQAAKNETESFQVVLFPQKSIKDISVKISDFKKAGSIIASENVTIRKVEYVHVTKPSGKLHEKGWYPDPLPLCNTPFDATEGINSPVWFTVKVPKDSAPGKYKATILFQSSSWKVKIPVELNVWDFSLPELPYMRSGFGLSSSRIKQYHNLETNEELEQVMDKYFREFKAYKVSPYHFDDLAPIKRKVKGIRWNGGTFEPSEPFQGKYSYNVKTNGKANYSELISINPAHPYLLKWQAKTLPKDQKYTVTVRCYDKDKKQLYWSLKWMTYEGAENWRQDTLYIDPENIFASEFLPDYRWFPEDARYASVHLHGPQSGEVLFDDFQFVDKETGKNLMTFGDFEQDMDELDLELDFSEFDIAARKYLDGFGFSGFRFGVPGLAKRSHGKLYGFVSGTSEYKKLMTLYLKGVQDHLEANGWLGKEYLYWADEPDHEHYKFVREGMDIIHEVAPKLTRFITENNPGPEIMDVTEIGCPVLYKANPKKIKEWTKTGRQFWSYLMCWPKEPHVNLFIDSDAINMRMWVWMSYKYNLTGVLVWNTNQWNGAKGAAPNGMVQNIWEDPMTYKSGHGTPFESAPEFGNGDGMFFYPPNRDPNHDKTKYLTGPVPSLRFEILREGLDDYDYMMLLEKCIKEANPDHKKLVSKATKVLDFGSEIFKSDRMYTKNPEILMEYRQQMGDLLEEFYKIKK